MRRRLFPNMIGDIVSMEERQERLERVMQILGVTPEFPFTMNVNDGTLNRVQIGLIGADYGIKIVDNAGNEVILANGTIRANAIKTGTLDCSLITVTNLDAGSITVGTLSASKISGGTLNASLMTVINLNAQSITVGTFASPNDRFTDESLNGVKISQGTIYGNRIVANSINADRIQAGTITADRITAKTITADRIQDNSLGTNQLIANGVHGNRIQDATIDNAKVANLSADKINAGTLTIGGGGHIGEAHFLGTSPAVFYNASGDVRGIIYSTGADFYIASQSGATLYLYAGSGQTYVMNGLRVDGEIITNQDHIRARGGGAYLYFATGYTNISSGAIDFANGKKLSVPSDKTAIVLTKEGYRALYCVESPDVWFMDFCKSKEEIDSLFLEVTEPPYHFIKYEGGEYQVWGRRKGSSGKRFAIKTEEEYYKNERFYSMAR